MTAFDRRLRELLEKIRRRAEADGVQWRKADKDVYAFRAGPYVITFAKERDPLIAIYDEHGEELEAVDWADLDGRTAADGKPLADVKARIWRLGRRGAGVSAAALDSVLDWLDEDAPHKAVEDEPPAAVEAAPADAEDVAPQAPQTPQTTGEPERREDPHPGTNGHSGPRPPWAQ